MRSDRERLLDMLEAIERIEKYTESDEHLLMKMNLSNMGYPSSSNCWRSGSEFV